MHLSVVNLPDNHYLAFKNNGTLYLLCDAATGKGIRCTSQGVVNLLFGANCNAPITFRYLDDVQYPNKMNANIGKAYCTLDEGDMEMTLRLEFGDFVASHHGRLIPVNSEGSYLMPEWEVNEQ